MVADCIFNVENEGVACAIQRHEPRRGHSASRREGGQVERGSGVCAVERTASAIIGLHLMWVQHVNIRLDADVLSAFKGTGSGWQTRLNNALRDWLALTPERRRATRRSDCGS